MLTRRLRLVSRASKKSELARETRLRQVTLHDFDVIDCPYSYGDNQAAQLELVESLISVSA